MNTIDLHIHTTASDGTLTPSEVVRLARKRALPAVGITDHDTVDGLEEAEKEGKVQDIEVVAGIEISTLFESGTLHLLGYFLNYRNEEFCSALRSIQESRSNRAPLMAARLRELGLEVEEEEISQLADGGQIGRPHFAQLLIQKGYVRDFAEAFRKYLGEGCPAHVGRVKPPPEKALELLKMSRAFPVLAHPGTLKLPEDGMKDLITKLVERGVQGIEAFYPLHSAVQTRHFLRLARHFGLAVTGGSDFHGPGRLKYELGGGTENRPIPYRLLQKMKIQHGF